MKRILPALVFGIALVAASAPIAKAVSLNLTGVSIAATGDPGLQIFTAPIALPFGTPNLTDNVPYTFELFDIWTTEGSIEPDDLVGRGINVQLTFDFIPPVGIGGTTVGNSQWVFIFNLQWGEVNWNAPASFDYAGKVFDVSLSSETFNGSLYSLLPGRDNGATVDATITQRQVPDAGSTLLMLGAGLAGMIGLRRRVR